MNYHVQYLRTWLSFQQGQVPPEKDLGALHKAPKGGQALLCLSLIYVDCLGMGTNYSPWPQLFCHLPSPYLPGRYFATNCP